MKFVKNSQDFSDNSDEQINGRDGTRPVPAVYLFIAVIGEILRIFHKFHQFFNQFWLNFIGISREFHEIVKYLEFLRNLWKSVKNWKKR